MSLTKYSEYKNSGVDWLGSVPAQWCVVRLKCKVTLVTEKATQRTYPVALENIEGWSGKFISTEGEFEGDGVAFAAGDLLFGKLRPYLAKAYLASGAGEAVGDFHVLRSSKALNPRFLQYQILNKAFIDVIDGSTFGSKMPRVSWESLGNMVVTLPSFDEQTAITAFLDRETAKIDALIAEQEKLIVLLTEKRQATISQGVTKGINPNAPMKDSGVAWLGEVPVHWDVVTFQRCVYVQEGQVNPEEEPYRSMLLIAPNHIESGTGRLLYTETAHEQSAESGKYLCNAGDVIYSKIRPALRKVCIAPENCLCSADMYPLRGTSKLLNVFLKWFILSAPFSALADLESQRVAMPKINRESLKVVWLAVPSLQEQEAIDAFLNEETAKLDLLADAASTAIKLLTERRSALIAAAVTGQIDVRSMISQVAAERPEPIAA
jgi:type I restriction enzyme S subunit